MSVIYADQARAGLPHAARGPAARCHSTGALGDGVAFGGKGGEGNESEELWIHSLKSLVKNGYVSSSEAPIFWGGPIDEKVGEKFCPAVVAVAHWGDTGVVWFGVGRDYIGFVMLCCFTESTKDCALQKPGQPLF